MSLLLLLVFVPLTTASCELDISKLLQNVNYSRTLSPVVAKGPLGVKVSCTVTKINELNTKRQTFQINMYFRQSWKDERLSWQNLKVFNECGSNETLIKDTKSSLIWRPDSFFSNANGLVSPGGEEFIYIYKDGLVLWSRRIVLTLFCTMEFQYYPFDVQHCQTTIESYGHGTDEMVYVQSEPTDRFSDTIDFLDSSVGTVAAYSLGLPTSVVGTVSIGGNIFSTVKLLWKFKRTPESYIVTPFSQIWLIVLCSFVGCCINPEAAPARVAIALITVLATINLLTRFAEEIPVVNYYTAMDYMYLVCTAFVVGNVVEYCFVNYALTLIKSKEQKLLELKTRRGATGESGFRSGKIKRHIAAATVQAEVRELFSIFDVWRCGGISRDDFKALLESAAADRGRTISTQLMKEMLSSVGNVISYKEVVASIADNPAIGMEQEPRAAILCFSFAVTRTTVVKMESIWRVWCPFLFVVLNIIWFVTVLKKDATTAYATAFPFLALFVVGIANHIRKEFVYPQNTMPDESLLSRMKMARKSVCHVDVRQRVDCQLEELVPSGGGSVGSEGNEEAPKAAEAW